MPYRIKKTDGTELTTIQDNTLDNTTTSLSLVGKRYSEYGELTAENLVHLMEHFASPTPPSNPIEGQVWFKTFDPSNPLVPTDKVKVWTGLYWRNVGGVYTTMEAPLNPEIADLWYKHSEKVIYFWEGTKWLPLGVNVNPNPPDDPSDGTFWWMMPERQLWVFDSQAPTSVPPKNRLNGTPVPTGWVLVGPIAPLDAKTYLQHSEVLDSNNNKVNVVTIITEDQILGLWSDRNFVLDSNTIDGRTFQAYDPAGVSTKTIKSGLNMNHGSGSVLNGRAEEANKWTTKRNLIANGDISGNFNQIDGTTNVTGTFNFSTSGINKILEKVRDALGNVYATKPVTPADNNYTGPLNPITLDVYKNFMAVVVVPSQSNTGPATLNIDGRGARQILRNDGLPLQREDLLANIPIILAYYNNNFYCTTLVGSQVPKIMTSTQDFWVRTDGNDLNDGRFNTPDRAFRTIQGAWAAIGNRYFPSPFYTIRIFLGNPGVYSGFYITNYSGRVVILGSSGNRNDYMISNGPRGILESSTINFSDNVSVVLNNLTVLVDDTTSSITHGITSSRNSNIYLEDVTIRCASTNMRAFCTIYGGYSGFLTYGDIIFDGQHYTIEAGIWLESNGTFHISYDTTTYSKIWFQNINFSRHAVAVFSGSQLRTHGPSASHIEFVNASSLSSIAVQSRVLLGGVYFPLPGFTVDASSVLIP